MNKKIKNIFVGTICAMFIAPAVGADASVAARTDCRVIVRGRRRDARRRDGCQQCLLLPVRQM